MNCKGAQAFREWQTPRLKKGVQDRRYFMGEAEGHVISFQEAEYDFIVTHHTYHLAPELRAEYCRDICQHREGCELAEGFIKQGESNQ